MIDHYNQCAKGYVYKLETYINICRMHHDEGTILVKIQSLMHVNRTFGCVQSGSLTFCIILHLVYMQTILFCVMGADLTVPHQSASKHFDELLTHIGFVPYAIENIQRVHAKLSKNAAIIVVTNIFEFELCFPILIRFDKETTTSFILSFSQHLLSFKCLRLLLDSYPLLLCFHLLLTVTFIF